jgi:hypothetical protein
LSIVVTFQDIAGDELKEQGLGGLYSVGQAATSPPRLLMLDYHPVTATTDPELLLKEFDSKVADLKHSVTESQTIANRRVPDTLSKRICISRTAVDICTWTWPDRCNARAGPRHMAWYLS